MSDPRWSDETEERVARAIHIADCEHSWEECRDWKAHGRAVGGILAALADAGLLVPLDAARDEQTGVYIPKTDQVSVCPPHGDCAHFGDEIERERVRTVVTFEMPWRTK